MTNEAWVELGQILCGCVCAQDPERALGIANPTPLLCARCVGVLFGAGTGFLVSTIRRWADPAPGATIAWATAIAIGLLAVALEHASGWALSAQARTATAAIAGMAGARLVTPVFWRVVDGRGRARTSDRGGAIATVALCPLAVPVATATGYDFLTPVAVVSLPIFSWVAASIVVSAFIRTGTSTPRVLTSGAVFVTVSFAIGYWLRH